jgi:hypothetical protein
MNKLIALLGQHNEVRGPSVFRRPLQQEGLIGRVSESARGAVVSTKPQGEWNLQRALNGTLAGKLAIELDDLGQVLSEARVFKSEILRAIKRSLKEPPEVAQQSLTLAVLDLKDDLESSGVVIGQSKDGNVLYLTLEPAEKVAKVFPEEV